MSEIRADRVTVDTILSLTNSVLGKCKKRAPGSQGSLNAADNLYEAMSGFCSNAKKETFDMHPGSLFAIGRVVGAVYVLSVALLVLGNAFSYAAAVLCIVSLAYAVTHYFLYGRVFDVFFKKKTGCNVFGVLEPLDTVKRQVIISGHHDGAYTFSFFSRFEKIAGIRLLLGVIFFTFITIVSMVFSIITAVGQDVRLESTLLIISLVGLLFAAPLFFFISRKVSPGAGDNLNGSSIAIHVVKHFAKTRRLKHTRLIALSTDGEEAGQRGAANYAKRHRHEWVNIPTYVINIDSVYKKDELAVMLRDRHGIVPLSRELAGICLETASELGYNAKKLTLPFGSGTDAAAFAKAKAKAVTVIAMSTSLLDEGHVYHTLGDTLESIEPEAVEAVFNIAANTVIKIDSAREI